MAARYANMCLAEVGLLEDVYVEWTHGQWAIGHRAENDPLVTKAMYLAAGKIYGEDDLNICPKHLNDWDSCRRQPIRESLMGYSCDDGACHGDD
jgi:hypothetical protein